MDEKMVSKLGDDELNEVTGGVGGFISNWSSIFNRNKNKTDDISKTELDGIDDNSINTMSC